MKLEFGNSIPEELKVPSLRLEYCSTCVDSFSIETKKCAAKILIGAIEYEAKDSNTHGDMLIWNNRNDYALCLDQQAEYKFFVYLLKFARDMGVLGEILASSKGNFYGFLQSYEGKDCDMYLGVVDEILINLNHEFINWGDHVESNPFQIFKGPHGSMQKYSLYYDTESEELILFSPAEGLNSEEEFRIHKSEILQYLRVLTLAAEQYAGRTPPLRYKQLLDVMFSQRFTEEYIQDDL